MFKPNVNGCNDVNCIFQDNSKTMVTNGGCKCERNLIRLKPEGFKAITTISFLRVQLNKRQCAWKLDEQDANVFKTDCGNMQCFADDGAEANDYIFFPYCGGTIDEC
ncbi:MAG: hypothetical protein QM504_10150 [Pseudomonadota bacterium]